MCAKERTRTKQRFGLISLRTALRRSARRPTLPVLCVHADELHFSLTGEVIADAGDAKVCGHSVRSDLSEARRSLGYCPQFSALPGALTGREVLRMYARLRGVPGGLIEGSVQSLLKRLDLCQYADRQVHHRAES